MRFERRYDAPPPVEIDIHVEVDADGREWVVRRYEPTSAPARPLRGARLSVSETSLLASVRADGGGPSSRPSRPPDTDVRGA